MASITLSDLLFLVCVVPVVLLSFLRQDWWLGPTICTISQAANNATMFCTFYGMVAMALLCHVAVAWPDVALPSGLGARLLLCGSWASLHRYPTGCSSEWSWRRRPRPASCS